MIPQPASRDGTVAGTNIATLFHDSDVPAGITAGPAAFTKDSEYHLDFGAQEENSFPRNSVFCDKKAAWY